MIKQVKKFFDKFWLWILLIPGVILGFIVLFWRRGGELWKLLTDLRSSSQKEVDQIKLARAEELEKIRQAEELHRQRMKKIEDEFQKERKNFDESKKQQVEQILKNTDSNPTKLAEELAKVTGFRIILPEE